MASITPIGQPVAAGQTVVVYGTENQHLYLYGVSVVDGTIRWRQAASPSLVTSGIPLTPRVLDDHVVYLRPDPSANLAARLVVASPETGTDRLVSGPMIFGSQPAHCADKKDVCVETADAGRPFVSRRFSVQAGGVVPDHGAAPPGSRYVGNDLLDLGDRQPEVLAGFQDGAVRWWSPLLNHFSAGYTTDRGWHFDLYASAGVHVGSVGRPPDRDDFSSVVTNLAKVETAGIDAATGRSAWRSEGTSYLCKSSVVLDRTMAGNQPELWPVRCRYRGSARYDRATKKTTYTGLDVTVEGFDVSTGVATWSLSLGSAEAFMVEDAEATPVTDSEVLLQGATGPVIVDLATGSTRQPRKGEAFMCAKTVIFDYHEPRHLTSGGTSNSHRGGTMLDTCAADRSPITAVPRDLPRSLGANVDRRTVVATPRGLVAYDRGAR